MLLSPESEVPNKFKFEHLARSPNCKARALYAILFSLTYNPNTHVDDGNDNDDSDTGNQVVIEQIKKHKRKERITADRAMRRAGMYNVSQSHAGHATWIARKTLHIGGRDEMR